MRSLAGRILWDQWAVYREALKTGWEWLLLPKGFASFVADCPLKLAVYIHDLIPLRCAERWPGSMSRRKLLYLKRSYAGTLKRADVVFTNTEYTRKDILRWAAEQKIDCPPVHVAGYGFSAPSGPAVRKDDQILVLIRPDRHKRPDLCLEYMRRWIRESGYGGRILCVGCFAEDVGVGQEPGWEWLGRIPAGLCTEQMRRSRIVVHFSEYEGFGMPPVESVLSGTCPVYSAIPVAVEVMQDCGCGFRNNRYADFTSAMQNALAATADQLLDWQQRLIDRHSWKNVTEKILSVVNE
ncbi:MAG: glycosyltransferase [Kiritimatiellales bacterium]